MAVASFLYVHGNNDLEKRLMEATTECEVLRTDIYFDLVYAEFFGEEFATAN